MNKKTQKINRQKRIRKKISGTASLPRLTVFRSNRYMYAQIIDDIKRKTLVGVSEKHMKDTKTNTKTALAKELGILLAKKAIEEKIKKVVFDKGSYAYHGRVKSLAEGAREGGLTF